MAEQTRFGTEMYDYSYYSYCGGSPGMYSGSRVSWFELVNSYRGKRLKTTVGKKKRKTFHDFKRYKESFGAASVFRWCPSHPGANRNLVSRGTQEANIKYCMDVPLDRPNPIVGDWPIIGWHRLVRHAAELQDVTSRDLYVKATEPRFDGLVMLAELDETLVGIRDIFKGSMGMLSSVKKWNRTMRQLLGNPQDLWLWYRYALMPAILSANDLIAAFSPKMEIDRIQTGSRPKETMMSGTLLNPGWDMGGGSYVTMDIPWKSKVTVSRGGALDFHFLRDPNEWGFSAVDIVRAGYERIPFSFVFDWFVNVGEWLQTLRNIEFDLAQSYVSTVINTVTDFEPGKDCFYEGTNPQLQCFLQLRTTGIEPPTKPLIDSRWVNTLRTIDSISLIVGFLKGFFTKKR